VRWLPRISGTVAIPSYKELPWPTLRAVREIGDSGTIEEIVEKVIELEGFTEEQQAVVHGPDQGARPSIASRAAASRRNRESPAHHPARAIAEGSRESRKARCPRAPGSP
jgi:hypothetical protein